jgi:hypothetical protein
MLRRISAGENALLNRECLQKSASSGGTRTYNPSVNRSESKSFVFSSNSFGFVCADAEVRSPI